MPTTLPRHQITETPRVAAALDRAAARWPGESRSQLVARLIELADAQFAADEEAARADRLAALEELASGRYAHWYPEGYLEELRHDRPE